MSKTVNRRNPGPGSSQPDWPNRRSSRSVHARFSDYETDSLPKSLNCNVENQTNGRSSYLKLVQVAGSEIEMTTASPCAEMRGRRLHDRVFFAQLQAASGCRSGLPPSFDRPCPPNSHLVLRCGRVQSTDFLQKFQCFMRQT